MSIPDKIPQLSIATSNVLSLVTDPYHDYNLRATGFPDGNVTISAIKRIQGRLSITCPFTLGMDESWDFHVFNTPFHYKTYAADATLIANFLSVNNPLTAANLGPVNVFYRQYDSLGNVINSRIYSLGNDAAQASPENSKQVRTVSLGFEIHNTTAELYKSGSITVYRTPVVFNDVHLSIQFQSVTKPFSAKLLGSIPVSLDAINLLPNSRTWEASAGAYIIGLPAPNNILSPYIPSNVLLQGGLLPTNFNLLYTEATSSVAQQSYSPLACGGAMSSRFKDSNQTFMLDFRQILEEVPNSLDTTTLAYATTAPALDKAFMKLYKAMFNQIPPGVPVSFNSAGDWFRSIIRIVKDTLPILVPVLPGQAKVLATAVLPIVNKALDHITREPSKPDVTQRMIKVNALKRTVKVKKTVPKAKRTRR